MLKLISWNVNGLRAVHRKGIFLPWLAEAQPDVLALQETKCHPDQLPDELRNPPGYHTYWAAAERGGYSGVGGVDDPIRSVDALYFSRRDTAASSSAAASAAGRCGSNLPGTAGQLRPDRRP